jgi:hypothetical protein
LSYAALKRSDLAKAEVLLNAGFKVQLAIVEIQKTGGTSGFHYDPDFPIDWEEYETYVNAIDVIDLPRGRATNTSIGIEISKEIVPIGMFTVTCDRHRDNIGDSTIVIRLN